MRTASHAAAPIRRPIVSFRRAKRAEQKLERGLAPAGRIERSIATALDFADMQRELQHFHH